MAFVAAALVITCTSSKASSDAGEANGAMNLNIDKMENEKDSLSYALGVLMGGQLKGQGFDLNPETFTAAFFTAKDGGELTMDEATANDVVRAFQQAQAGKQAQKNKDEGAALMATNGERDGVTTLASGMQFEILQEGTGAKPAGSDASVTVHYTGTLLDGSVFDSSVERGQPATFGLNQVISGWTEGVQLMNEGSKYRFWIPSDMAYGDQGRPGIPPGATLIFDVELIKVN